MMTTRMRRHTLAPLVIAVVAASIALALVAAEARATDGGMSSMPGMSAEEMQNMATPAPAPSATAMSGAGSQGAMPATTSGDGHGSGAVMDPNMDMGGGSANWFVVGSFGALIAGATIAAAATKRHLRRRMLTGELAGEGVLDV
jgi:hypothetical protein